MNPNIIDGIEETQRIISAIDDLNLLYDENGGNEIAPFRFVSLGHSYECVELFGRVIWDTEDMYAEVADWVKFLKNKADNFLTESMRMITKPNS